MIMMMCLSALGAEVQSALLTLVTGNRILIWTPFGCIADAKLNFTSRIKGQLVKLILRLIQDMGRLGRFSSTFLFS